MPFTRFERRSEPLAPRGVFLRRLGRNVLFAVLVILVSLAAGMVGYRATEGFLNAAMILSGMGPVGALQHAGAKLFAGLFALYSGLLVVITTGVILAPVLHRVLHGIHAADEDEEKADEKKARGGKMGGAGAKR
jgi:hypothetical protein